MLSGTARKMLAAAVLAMPALGQQDSIQARPNQRGEIITPPAQPRRRTKQDQARIAAAEAKRTRKNLKRLRDHWRDMDARAWHAPR